MVSRGPQKHLHSSADVCGDHVACGGCRSTDAMSVAGIYEDSHVTVAETSGPRCVCPDKAPLEDEIVTRHVNAEPVEAVDNQPAHRCVSASQIQPDSRNSRARAVELNGRRRASGALG